MKNWIKTILITIVICIVIAIIVFAFAYMLLFHPIGLTIIYFIIGIFVIGYIVREKII